MKKVKKVFLTFLALLLIAIAIPINTHAANVTLNKTRATLTCGDSVTLKLIGTNQKVSWKSDKKSVANVNGNGIVIAKKSGTATITGKIGNKNYKCKITVKQPKLSINTLSLSKGSYKSVRLYNVYGKGKVIWSSSDSSVISVIPEDQASAKLFAKKDGSATITAKIYGKSYTFNVIVKKKTVSNIKINKTNTTVLISYSKQLKVSGTSKKVIWSSSNSFVAKVDNNGKVTGKKAGTTVITAKVDGMKLQCKVIVPKYRLNLIENKIIKEHHTQINGAWYFYDEKTVAIRKDVKDVTLAWDLTDPRYIYDSFTFGLSGVSAADKVTWELEGSKKVVDCWGSTVDRTGYIDGCAFTESGHTQIYNGITLDNSGYYWRYSISGINNYSNSLLHNGSGKLHIKINGKTMFTVKIKLGGY